MKQTTRLPTNIVINTQQLGSKYSLINTGDVCKAIKAMCELWDTEKMNLHTIRGTQNYFYFNYSFAGGSKSASESYNKCQIVNG